MSLDKDYEFNWREVVKIIAERDPNIPLDNPLFETTMRKLAEVVCNRHYGYFSKSFKEELVREGVLKAYQLLNAPHLDLNRPIKPFFYQGMHNNMNNFIFKNNKEKSMPEFQMEIEKSDPDGDLWGAVIIDGKTIHDVFKKFNMAYDKYVPLVIQTLEDMGFRLVDIPSKLRTYCEDNPELVSSLSTKIRDRFICIIIGERLEQIL